MYTDQIFSNSPPVMVTRGEAVGTEGSFVAGGVTDVRLASQILR